MIDPLIRLQRAGRALYGARWQRDLARDLRIAERTIRRWISDPSTIPDRTWPEIIGLLAARADFMAKLQAELSSAAKKARSPMVPTGTSP
jgi:hypothetical protein